MGYKKKKIDLVVFLNTPVLNNSEYL